MKEFDDCPCCPTWCIAVINGKIVRHEKGLGYVPYRLYHRIERKTGTSIRDQMRKNLCLASGKTMEQARTLAKKLLGVEE